MGADSLFACLPALSNDGLAYAALIQSIADRDRRPASILAIVAKTDCPAVPVTNCTG
jgi:hypothetical protein